MRPRGQAAQEQSPAGCRTHSAWRRLGLGSGLALGLGLGLAGSGLGSALTPTLT
jgi:hypothetical protein